MIVDVTIHEDFITSMDNKEYASRTGVKDSWELKRRRLECEAYEWHMVHNKVWEDHKPWDADGKSDKYGTVEVKTVGLSKEFQPTYNTDKRYWALPGYKISNIMRQRKTVDNWYFIEWLERPEGLLIAGDQVKYNFLGVLTFEEICDHMQPSRYSGCYIDLNKALGI